MFREAEEHMEQMYYFVRILLIWLLCLLSVLLHELGHALGYRIFTGKAKWKVIADSDEEDGVMAPVTGLTVPEVITL